MMGPRSMPKFQVKFVTENAEDILLLGLLVVALPPVLSSPGREDEEVAELATGGWKDFMTS